MLWIKVLTQLILKLKPRSATKALYRLSDLTVERVKVSSGRLDEGAVFRSSWEESENEEEKR